ncbi:MAG: protein-glutamate O-methyltransferase CheR [Candidatus Polarisedimenticolaceae bacterium]|nr:protein-glutamate O-methyltransferase CheR [Candidatus Polarisedimenticolaceae bacterium]
MSLSNKKITAKEYSVFRAYLQDACGILLGDGKEYLVESRLNSLTKKHQIVSLTELFRSLYSGRLPHLKVAVIDAMTTNETFWFRDMAHFNILSELIFSEAESTIGKSLRIWSAACSSGQEPYTISMEVQRYLASHPGRLRGGVEVIATDISTHILEEARRGVYNGMSVSRGLNQEQRGRFFVKSDDELAVRPEIKKRVKFQEINLSASYDRLGKFDVIFCRNVLIYFSNTLKQDILTRMAKSLKPGGYLFLGSTESLTQHSADFKMVRCHGGIVYQLDKK